RSVLPAPRRYPLKRVQGLAAYCQNVLGLRKPLGPPGRSTPGGCPPGCDIACKLCPPPAGSS
ncbi:MAG: hypothetical protein NTW03_01940, partial [Verrucomicrobia bacterium]|nr:hypothetical protein [Verrucomicrobiota bacterium]